jgi:uncharacterized heparinase superfamily protein
MEEGRCSTFVGRQDCAAYRGGARKFALPAARLRSAAERAALYWNTLRHLRARQIVGRALHVLSHPAPDLAPAPPRRVSAGLWIEPARRESSLIGPRSFRFLNETGELDVCGWDDPARGKLWRYNQHYFDDMNALGSHARATWHAGLVENWIAANPPGQGTGWEPYPTSLRIVNWVKHALSGGALSEAALHSLAVQARWLSRRIEWRLLGNHLFANAKALVFAGLFFDGEEAARWRATGLRILAREIPEQILGDGGHFELSPMYHAIALEDMLDLQNVMRSFDAGDDNATRACVTAVECRLEGMLAWLDAMTHPDGGPSFFNDCALAIAPTKEELDSYAARLGVRWAPSAPGSLHLPDSGYARLSCGPAVLIADMAHVGPDYLPGHAHADTLSFELSLFGARVLVNSGTSTYADGPERLRQRGTAAHNTVLLDGQDSSQVWSSFRVARRAYPIGARAWSEGELLLAEASHDGYARLSDRPVHRRRWRLSSSCLSIEDTFTGGPVTAQARFHLHPSVAFEVVNPNYCRLEFEGRSAGIETDGGLLRCEPASWHPEFGLAFRTCCLVLPLRDGRSRLDLRWN